MGWIAHNNRQISYLKLVVHSTKRPNMINLQNFANKSSRLLQRIDHGVPTAAMNANTNANVTPASVITMTEMTDASAQGNRERNVQHIQIQASASQIGN